MVRKYIKKTTQGLWCPEKLKEAIKKVREKEMTVRKASKTYGIPQTTLKRRIVADKDGAVRRGRGPAMDQDAEKKFAGRITYLTNRGFSLTVKNIRKYAYDFATRNKLEHTFSTVKKTAGEDWYYRFKHRNNVVIPKQEIPSKAKIVEMQNDKIVEFYKNLEKIMDDYDLKDHPESIYYLDETILPHTNHLAQVLGSGCNYTMEPADNVTIMTCINAIGQYIPPFLVFKESHVRDDVLVGLPRGSEVAITEEGFVTDDAFKQWLEHFNRYRIKGTVILILSSYLTCTNLTLVDICEASGIEILLMPSQAPSTIKPLDLSFFETLKAYYNQQVTVWQYSAGQTTNRNIFGNLFKQAWNLAANIGNATDGFEKTGIFPFNPHTLTEHRFVMNSMINSSPSPNLFTYVPSTSVTAQLPRPSAPYARTETLNNTHSSPEMLDGGCSSVSRQELPPNTHCSTGLKSELSPTGHCSTVSRPDLPANSHCSTPSRSELLSNSHCSTVSRPELSSSSHCSPASRQDVASSSHCSMVSRLDLPPRNHCSTIPRHELPPNSAPTHSRSELSMHAQMSSVRPELPSGQLSGTRTDVSDTIKDFLLSL